MRRAFEWMFRNRETGKITVAQFPNIPLAVWIACSIVGATLRLRGGLGTGLKVVGTVALAVWAGDEIWRGVSPFRRILGGVVLLGLLARLALR